MPNAADDASNKKPWRRLPLKLAIGIVLLAAAYTVAWFTLANRFEAHIPEFFARAAEEGISASCDQYSVTGFPLAMGLNCSRASAKIARQNGLTIESGPASSASPVYNPGRFVSRFEGPLTISNDAGLSARFDWKDLETLTALASDGLDAASIKGDQVTMTIDGPFLPGTVAATILRLDATMRREQNDLDIVVMADEFASPVILDSRHFWLMAKVTQGAELLSDREDRSLRGKSLMIGELGSELPDGGSFIIDGKLDISQQGLADGDLRIRIKDIETVMAQVGQLNPDLQNQFRTFGSIITALDTEPEDGRETVTLPLTIRQNRVNIGILPLGVLPAF